MLEGRGSNPVHSASKNTTNPEAEWFPEEPGAPPDLWIECKGRGQAENKDTNVNSKSSQN